MNARASRTTHPKTIGLLEAFFSEVDESKIKITTPFPSFVLSDVGQQDLITSQYLAAKHLKIVIKQLTVAVVHSVIEDLLPMARDWMTRMKAASGFHSGGNRK